VIRIDAVWLAVEPLDMRAGTEAALRRVVAVFGAARPNHAYLFVNRRANRMKVLVHDGIGAWLAARRLNAGRFVWPRDVTGTLNLNRAQFDALVLGLRRRGWRHHAAVAPRPLRHLPMGGSVCAGQHHVS